MTGAEGGVWFYTFIFTTLEEVETGQPLAPEVRTSHGVREGTPGVNAACRGNKRENGAIKKKKTSTRDTDYWCWLMNMLGDSLSYTEEDQIR